MNNWNLKAIHTASQMTDNCFYSTKRKTTFFDERKLIFDVISPNKLMTVVPLVYQAVHVSLKRYMYPAIIKEKLCLNIRSKVVTPVQLVFLVNKKTE